METKMRKFLTGMIGAAVLIAASAGLAAAQQYPACTSKSDDKCMQGTGMMPGAAKMPMHKGAKTMGGAMKPGAGPMKKMMGTGGAASGANIPHGCSPATTPCE